MPVSTLRGKIEEFFRSLSQGRPAVTLGQKCGMDRDDNLAGVMCRNLVSVDWQGYVYDCDFNQMLDLRAPGGGTAPSVFRIAVARLP